MSLLAVFPLVGRLLLASVFLVSGAGKILNTADNVQYMESQGIPMAGLLIYAAIAAEIAGGLSVLLGVYAHWGALVLFLYLIPTTLVFHTDFADQNQQFHFMKNLAIMGGLLMMVYFGSGPLSLAGGRPPVSG